MNPSQKIAARIVFFLILFHCNHLGFGNGSTMRAAAVVNLQEPKLKMPKPPKLPQEPKLPKPPKLPTDTAANLKLIQRVLKFFRFRHNALARERARVLYIINQTLSDSLVVSKDDIRKLNAALMKKENQQFDSLMALLNQIALSHAVDTAATTKNTTEKIPVREPDKSVQGTDLDALVDKMMPILQKKSEEQQAEEAKAAHLKAVRSLYGRPPGQMDTLKLSDSIGARYQLRLSQKIDVMGIQPYWMEKGYTSYNYNALGTFSFLGYLVNGQSGVIQPAFQESDIQSTATAKSAGCSLQLLFLEKKSDNILALLKNKSAQTVFADSLARLLARQQADGVTIYFQGLPDHQRTAFSSFITFLSATLKNADKNFKVNVVVPVYDRFYNYDLRALRTSVDFFIIDFTQAAGETAMALAPLGGNAARSVEGAVSRYLQGDIPPAQLSLLLPYYGAVWKKGKNGSPDTFSHYVSYSDLRKQYPSDTVPIFDETSASFFIEVRDQYGDVREEIWFDDGISMGMKYDYVLKNGIGGVALWTLGADEGRTELWDALVDKFVVTDTLFLDTIPLRPLAPLHLTWWQRIKRELAIYVVLFKDPCSVDVSQYEGDTYFIYFAIGFGVLLVIAGAAYFYFVKTQGDDWKWRKKLLIVLIALVLLTVVSTFMAFFLNKEMSFVGISSIPGQCHSVPLTSILIILGIGLVLGLAIMHFLLQPLFKNDDIP